LKKHIAPYLGGVPLGRLDTPLVREWRAKLLSQGISPGMAAKAYRLLRAILWTAVREDGLLTKNPCRIPGADKEAPAERPHLTLAQVTQLADAIPKRYHLMILVTALASLRFGEVTALQRSDVDLQSATVAILHQFVEIRGEGLVLGPPKSRAGVRLIAVPTELVPLLESHLGGFVGPSGSAFLFTTTNGSPVRRGSFNKLVDWRGAVQSIGVPRLHFHDLRHTGNMLAAGSRATTRDLMSRIGHDSMAAALIYQHASREADRSIASHLNEQMGLVAQQSNAPSKPDTEVVSERLNGRRSGPSVARSDFAGATPEPARRQKGH
jgi:integrase